MHTQTEESTKDESWADVSIACDSSVNQHTDEQQREADSKLGAFPDGRMIWRTGSSLPDSDQWTRHSILLSIGIQRSCAMKVLWWPLGNMALAGDA